MALFACQNLDKFPAELPTLTLVFCLVLCLVLVPGTMLTLSALRRNLLIHSVGIATLAACILKAFLEKWLMDPSSKSTLGSWLIFTGIATGRALAMYLGMMLLGISRKSVVSDWRGLDYTNMIAFHRVVGWWVVAMSVLHSLAFIFYYLQKGGWHQLLMECFPIAGACNPEDQDCWNIIGLINFFGVVAFAATIVLGIFSQQRVRRGFYNLFYFTHLVSSFVFLLFCGLHDFPSVILMFPGLVLYFRDRFIGFTSRDKNTEVTVHILCRREASCLLLLSWYPTRDKRGSHLLPGTRWVYLQEKSISRLQWHPYSAIFHGDRACILLKGVGDWSASLCNLANGNALGLSIEGPYGKPMSDTMTSQPQALLGIQSRDHEDCTLLLLAGGVGISPFIDLIAGLPLIEDASWHRIKLVWAVRGEEYNGLVAATDLHFLSQRAEVSVFVTSEVPVASAFEEGLLNELIRIRPTESEAPPPQNRRHFGPITWWSFVLIVAGATASDFLAHSWAIRVRMYVSSFLEWALLTRVVPILFVAIAVVLIGTGLLLIPTCSRRCQVETLDSPAPVSLSRRQVEAGLGREISGQSLNIQHCKLNIQSLLEQEAELGPLELKACGPERMLSALTDTARLLNSRGHKVVLDKLESEL
eukprot:Skav200452  [mRNA]  locus=scaffold1922:182427:184355:- [translate_table: standard]